VVPGERTGARPDRQSEGGSGRAFPGEIVATNLAERVVGVVFRHAPANSGTRFLG
jgi:hypothetical protein